MSARSKSSLLRKKTKKSQATKIQAQARALADQYQVILRQEDGEWYGRGLEMPYVFGDGKTPTACLTSMREALNAAIVYLLESGQSPPPPARGGKRTMQVNVRLTPEEKARLESVAQRKGFEGLSDFVRAAALKEAP
jgi:predicted RNase H-like HicB family nuclease